MKIPAINILSYRHQNVQKKGVTAPLSFECENSKPLNNNFYYPTNISFGLANAESLKKLFSYGLPCMYTGVEMIDPQKILAIMKMGLNKISVKDVIKLLQPYDNSILNKEKEVFNIIKAQAEKEPDKSLQETLSNLQKEYEDELIKKQIPIFKTLRAYSYSLPENIRYEFNQLMDETDNKISRNPIFSDFSANEFQYKLERIKDDIGKLHDRKALTIINNLIKACKNFEPHTTAKNIHEQRKVFSDMEKTLKRSVLRNNKALETLFTTTKAKLNEEKVKIDFSRKPFIHDLGKILKQLEDKELKSTFLKIAAKLPTSQDSTAAYITKLAKEPPDMIIFRLLWPCSASVEHLLPRFCGGEDKMKNYGGACAAINSARQHDPFKEQMKRIPATPINCQKYLDRLIEYAKMGIFKKENIDIQCIEDFKETIGTLSEGEIILDTSKLYEDGRFPKPESALEKLNLN